MKIGRDIKYIALCAVVTLMAVACHKEKKSYDEIGESGLTVRTENLRANLLPYEDKGVMIGQMYGTTEGLGWKGDSARSDFHEVCDDSPACTGFELAGIENGNKKNSDSIEFSLIKKDIIEYFQHQTLVVLKWTAPKYSSDKELAVNVKKVASFINSLQNAYGIKVPALLYLYPLGGSTWYDSLGSSEYQELYVKTKKLLKKYDVNNAVFGFSNGAVTSSAEEFVKKCPTNEIDVIQFDYVTDNADGYADNLKMMCKMISSYSISIMKVFGVITGVKGLDNDSKEFWTGNLIPVIENSRMSYLMLGRNHGDRENHDYCGPYPGNQSVEDFVKLYNNPRTLFMSNVNGLLLNHSEKNNK